MGWFGSVTTPRATFGPCALLGSLAEIATAGAAAATPTLITAIRGAFNGPPHVAVQLSASPSSRSVRQSVTSFVRRADGHLAGAGRIGALLQAERSRRPSLLAQRRCRVVSV